MPVPPSGLHSLCSAFVVVGRGLLSFLLFVWQGGHSFGAHLGRETNARFFGVD